MKRVRRRETVIIVLAALAALSCASATTILAANHAITVRAGNLVFQGEAAFRPKALPKNKMAPISFHGSASVETANGTHVPPAQTVHLQVDKHFRIESTGLPSCAVGKIEATSPSQAMKACSPALIGKGSATAQVEFAESLPFSAKGPILGFNGPTVGGYPEMLYYVYVAVPAPTALVVVAKLSKDTGKYGYRISVAVPEIAGGSGSLTSFELTINRKWTDKGQQHSYLNAECPDGHFFNQFEAAFGGGTNLSGSIVNSCQSKG
jgi:hypothetical protein